MAVRAISLANQQMERQGNYAEMVVIMFESISRAIFPANQLMEQQGFSVKQRFAFLQEQEGKSWVNE